MAGGAIWWGSCISFDSYIKPQPFFSACCCSAVVYLLTPTSNHNVAPFGWRLSPLYIFWLLHQTTTAACIILEPSGCISFDSYIKPQLFLFTKPLKLVVYLLTPTSNHNPISHLLTFLTLYIFWLLHQTTTSPQNLSDNDTLYIFWLLHQTTTLHSFTKKRSRCISFDSYIKPQQSRLRVLPSAVVYLLTPTSNHNPIPAGAYFNVLYIFWLLHQTTTWLFRYLHSYCCISFDSYIKPQPHHDRLSNASVVYLLTPTSNHNQNQW